MISAAFLAPYAIGLLSSSTYRLRDEISSHHPFHLPGNCARPRAVKLFPKNNLLRLSMIPNGFGPELALQTSRKGSIAQAHGRS